MVDHRTPFNFTITYKIIKPVAVEIKRLRAEKIQSNNLFMAIPAARVNPLMISRNVEGDNKGRRARREAKAPSEGGRRELLRLLSTATATALASDSKTDLLNKYLKKSEENKAKNDKERLDSYYKRNYKDYFGLLEGDLRQKKDLSESEKGILEWLDNNK
ncbi:hypothetical protein BUALT_Bualt01G0122300 [Buddleja alternifolia]|uniref:Uncharacterized protein n=1 Tax=Buddleja alternifolia TaxID=168488 RepID=A0AAV6YHB5_9LAMI|nr:hypothetical protein BUALT_Bualt01G0122300 [Buddleja alternifolia]